MPMGPGCSPAAMAHHLLRGAGTLTGRTGARARGLTLRRQLVNVATRLAHRAHGIDLHLPEHWPWAGHWELLFDATHQPISIAPT